MPPRSIDGVSHELTEAAFGYTLFALMSLSAWSTIGSFSVGQQDGHVWELFHRVTPYVVCTVSLIAIILLCVDFF